MGKTIFIIIVACLVFWRFIKAIDPKADPSMTKFLKVVRPLIIIGLIVVGIWGVWNMEQNTQNKKIVETWLAEIKAHTIIFDPDAEVLTLPMYESSFGDLYNQFITNLGYIQEAKLLSYSFNEEKTKIYNEKVNEIDWDRPLENMYGRAYDIEFYTRDPVNDIKVKKDYRIRCATPGLIWKMSIGILPAWQTRQMFEEGPPKPIIFIIDKEKCSCVGENEYSSNWRLRN